MTGATTLTLPVKLQCTYTVRVQVWDGLDEHRNEQDTSIFNDDNTANDDTIIDDTITVNIMVSDVAERPEAPTVTVTSLVVGSNRNRGITNGDLG